MLIDHNNFQVQAIFGPAQAYQPISALSKSISHKKAPKFSIFTSSIFIFIAMEVQAFYNDVQRQIIKISVCNNIKHSYFWLSGNKRETNVCVSQDFLCCKGCIGFLFLCFKGCIGFLFLCFKGCIGVPFSYTYSGRCEKKDISIFIEEDGNVSAVFADASCAQFVQRNLGFLPKRVLNITKKHQLCVKLHRPQSSSINRFRNAKRIIIVYTFTGQREH